MKTLLFAIAIFLLNGVSFAQSPIVQVGFHSNIGFPIGEFRETVNNSIGGTGWGVGMTMLLNPKKGNAYSPVLIGIEGNYMNLGRDKTPETISLPQLKTTFNYFNVGPLLRFYLSDKEEGFTPFLDGFVGLKVLNFNTKIDNTIFDTLSDEENLESLLSTNNNGLGYGMGFGFYNRKIHDPNKSGNLSFFMRLMYQYGDRTTYVKRGSIQVDSDGLITYQTGRTETSMLSLQFGVLF